jgi:hypothetical protein
MCVIIKHLFGLLLLSLASSTNPMPDVARMRSSILKLTSGAISTLLGVKCASAASIEQAKDNNDVIFSLEYLDGVITTNYSLNPESASKGVRAIVDTGSPFLIVPTICTSLWGCPSRQELQALRPSGLEDTVEVFGGQDYDTSWALLNRGVTPLPPPSSTRKGDYPRLLRNDAVVATVGSDIMLPPGGVFFGLIKYKSQFIRPTFLGQTNVKSFSIDLRKNELSMSTKRKISPGSPNSFHMIDLRPLGDSVYHYACRVANVRVNGVSITDDLPMAQPIYAIFDTGTSGCGIHDVLYFGESMPLPARRVELDLENVLGERVTLKAEATRKELFVVTPSKIPWFDASTNKHPEDMPDYTDSGRFEPRVIVLGTSFFKNRKLTIDIDDAKIELV